jgi:hypothetical protein
MDHVGQKPRTLRGECGCTNYMPLDYPKGDRLVNLITRSISMDRVGQKLRTLRGECGCTNYTPRDYSKREPNQSIDLDGSWGSETKNP